MGGISSVPRVRSDHDSVWSSSDRWEIVLPENDALNKLLDSEFNWKLAYKPLFFSQSAMNTGHIIFSRAVERIRQSRSVYGHSWMIGNVNAQGAKQGTWLQMSLEDYVTRALVYKSGVPIVVYSYALCEPRRLISMYDASTNITTTMYDNDRQDDDSTQEVGRGAQSIGSNDNDHYKPLPLLLLDDNNDNRRYRRRDNTNYNPPPDIHQYVPGPIPLQDDTNYEGVNDIFAKSKSYNFDVLL